MPRAILQRVFGLLTVLAVAAACIESPQNRLISAILAGDVKTVASLLDDPSVNVNWGAPMTGSALQVAATYSQPNQDAIVRLLLRRGADPNIGNDENMTPLNSAAYHGYTSVVEQLIEAGANVDAAETRYGYTPLAHAARNGHVQIIKLLLSAGANRQAMLKDGRTAVMVARQYGHVDAADALTYFQPGTNGEQ
jgi:ankyrin repeat protein